MACLTVGMWIRGRACAQEMEALKEEGLVSRLGVCDFTLAQLQAFVPMVKVCGGWARVLGVHTHARAVYVCVRE
jgi:hypothetical protein